MKFQTKIDESIFVSQIVPERKYMFDADLRMGLSIIWNIGKDAHFMIDNELIVIHKNCVILRDFHVRDVNIL